MHSKTNRKLNFLKEFIQKNYSNWEKEYPNMLGAYAGIKHRKNEPLKRYAIVFMVSQKDSEINNRIPKYFTIDVPNSGFKRIPTDVVISRKYNLWNVSLSGKIEKPSTLEYGTIGVFLKKDGHNYVCTNAHVLLKDKIEKGETTFFRPIEQQFQPDVNLYDQSGRVFQAYLQEGIFGGIDAAICRLEDEGSIDNLIPGFGVPTGIRTIRNGEDGYKVKMVGFKTSFSEGVVKRIGLTIPTPYPNIFFHDVIEVSLNSKNGDSGSPVFNEALKIIGIIVGGIDDSAYVIPIKQILDHFNCTLLI